MQMDSEEPPWTETEHHKCVLLMTAKINENMAATSDELRMLQPPDQRTFESVAAALDRSASAVQWHWTLFTWLRGLVFHGRPVFERNIVSALTACESLGYNRVSLLRAGAASTSRLGKARFVKLMERLDSLRDQLGSNDPGTDILDGSDSLDRTNSKPSLLRDIICTALHGQQLQPASDAAASLSASSTFAGHTGTSRGDVSHGVVRLEDVNLPGAAARCMSSITACPLLDKSDSDMTVSESDLSDSGRTEPDDSVDLGEGCRRCVTDLRGSDALGAELATARRATAGPSTRTARVSRSSSHRRAVGKLAAAKRESREDDGLPATEAYYHQQLVSCGLSQVFGANSDRQAFFKRLASSSSGRRFNEEAWHRARQSFPLESEPSLPPGSPPGSPPTEWNWRAMSENSRMAKEMLSPAGFDCYQGLVRDLAMLPTDSCDGLPKQLARRLERFFRLHDHHPTRFPDSAVGVTHQQRYDLYHHLIDRLPLLIVRAIAKTFDQTRLPSAGHSERLPSGASSSGMATVESASPAAESAVPAAEPAALCQPLDKSVALTEPEVMADLTVSASTAEEGQRRRKGRKKKKKRADGQAGGDESTVGGGGEEAPLGEAVVAESAATCLSGRSSARGGRLPARLSHIIANLPESSMEASRDALSGGEGDCISIDCSQEEVVREPPGSAGEQNGLSRSLEEMGGLTPEEASQLFKAMDRNARISIGTRTSASAEHMSGGLRDTGGRRLDQAAPQAAQVQPPQTEAADEATPPIPNTQWSRLPSVASEDGVAAQQLEEVVARLAEMVRQRDDARRRAAVAELERDEAVREREAANNQLQEQRTVAEAQAGASVAEMVRQLDDARRRAAVAELERDEAVREREAAESQLQEQRTVAEAQAEASRFEFRALYSEVAEQCEAQAALVQAREQEAHAERCKAELASERADAESAARHTAERAVAKLHEQLEERTPQPMPTSVEQTLRACLAGDESLLETMALVDVERLADGLKVVVERVEVVRERMRAEEREKDAVCIICMTNPKDATIIHGDSGHICCCISCAKDLYRLKHHCPICRQPIDAVIRQFAS